MPRIIRMPSTDVVRGGTKRRGFVAEMFRLYRAAGSPALREVEDWIRANDDLKGTASTETIRRILRGHVPPRWHTVEAIALAFFAMSDLEPGQERWTDNMNEPISNMEALHQTWAEAIEEDPNAPDPRARRQTGNFDDPWATARSSNFDDEPPF